VLAAMLEVPSVTKTPVLPLPRTVLRSSRRRRSQRCERVTLAIPERADRATEMRGSRTEERPSDRSARRVIASAARWHVACESGAHPFFFV
jgi:hypothetical protein